MKTQTDKHSDSSSASVASDKLSGKGLHDSPNQSRETGVGFVAAPSAYPNHLRCVECETLIHKSNVKKHDCCHMDAKALKHAWNCPKSLTLRLR